MTPSPNTPSTRAAGAGPTAGIAAAEGPAAFAARLLQVAGALGVSLGVANLALWFLRVAPRWDAQGALTMRANTAFSLALAGAALLLLGGEPGRYRRGLALAPSAVVFSVGALTLAEHLGGVDLGIDRLLTRAPSGATGPSRTGPPGAVSFTLLGLGLAALALRRRVAAFFGCAVCCIVLVPAVGWLYGVGELRAGAIRAEWPTVAALLLLGFGLAVSRPDPDHVPTLLRDDPGGALLRRVLVPAAVLPILVGWLRIQGEQLGLYSRHVGTGLFAVCVTVLLCLLLWRAAGGLSAAALERRRVEAAAAAVLRGSEERHRALARDRQLALDAAQLGWWSFDPATELVTYDTRYGEIHGLSGERSPAAEIRAVLHPDDTQIVNSSFAAALHPSREGETQSIRYRLVRADGTVRWVEAAGLVTFEGEGPARHPVAFIGTAQDVTARRTAEEAVREANAQLVNADRRKDEFLGMLSHELRNPLAPIRNALYILERSEPGRSPQARRAVEIASRQLGHLTRLVDDLLDVTRIAQGKIRLNRAEVDLAALVRRAAEDHRALMDERGLELAVRDPGQPLVVLGDETRLAQVVGNLLNNAAKFTPAGGRVSLSVGTEGESAALRVTDTGAGIDPELLAAIFSPFTQGAQTLARTEGGLGLGLALVQAIVALHGGVTWAQSEGTGRGAEFVVKLPLAERAERSPGGGISSTPA